MSIDLTPRDPTSPFDFTPFIFLGWIEGNVSINAKGDLHFKVVVPFQYRDSAMGIWNANTAPLKIQIERWEGPGPE